MSIHTQMHMYSYVYLHISEAKWGCTDDANYFEMCLNLLEDFCAENSMSLFITTAFFYAACNI